jgi:hypothetical protein
MKHFLLLFTFAGLLALQLCAQDTTSMGTIYDSTDYNSLFKWNRLYQDVNPEKATTGFLIDKAFNFIDPLKHTNFFVFF